MTPPICSFLRVTLAYENPKHRGESLIDRLYTLLCFPTIRRDNEQNRTTNEIRF